MKKNETQIEETVRNTILKMQAESKNEECKDTGQKSIPGQKVKDKTSLIGRRFGRLLVIRWSGVDKNSQSLWLCECDCTNQKEIARGSLLRKDNKATKSCGCLHIENINTGTNKKHGKCGTQLYSTWAGMIQRCTNPNQEAYIHYGGRGIRVCKSWLENFENFYNDIIKNIGERPKNKTLDRKDNNMNYSCGHCEECTKNGWKFNCQWSTMKEQTWNTRHNKFITFNNETKCLQEWSEIYNIPCQVLADRIRAKWTMEKAISVPIDISLNNTENFYTFNEKTRSLTAWSKELGISYATLYCRINKYGWSIEDALSSPLLK